MWYIERVRFDRRYFRVTRLNIIDGQIYFGCTTFVAVMDDFGELVEVDPLRYYR